MDLPYRLESAIKKLYTAYHSNQLFPECCKQCAVGNILDKTDIWKHLSNNHGTLQLNYVGRVHQNLGRRFNGYSPLELLQIEAIFLKACGFKIPLNYTNEKPKNTTDKQVLFDGLFAVISYLCKLDGVGNVMEYTKLFDFENNKPSYTL